MICAIIDYGSGNLHSAVKSFERAALESGSNSKIILTNDPSMIETADQIVLPGVGAYKDCLTGLEAIEGLRPALEKAVVEKAKPFFGICVGMQLMSTEGLEHGITKGLDWIGGKVAPIKPNNPALKIPHMGWNTLEMNKPGRNVDGKEACEHPVLNDIELGENGWHAYFVHSYHFEVTNPTHCLITTDYGGPITAMIGRDNIIGTQFHPEKSQKLGLKLISNFLNWRP